MKVRTAIVLVICAALATTGCAVGPDYKRPTMVEPPGWRTPTEGAGSMADLGWWQIFEDSVLQNLIRTAINENTDLRLASGLGTYEAQREAYARVYRVVRDRAQTLAFIDMYWLLAVAAAVMVAVAFTLRRNDPRLGGQVIAH
jgi:hypothetical protein